MTVLIRQYLQHNQQKLARLLQSLIRIPTVNPPGSSYQEMVSLLCDICDQIGIENRVYKVPDVEVRNAVGCSNYPRYNVLAHWNVGAKQTLHFNAHYDVVPVSGKWKFGDPFEPAMVGGSVYGRGSADMKGSIAALLGAIDAIKKSSIEPEFNIEISFTADEETGGHLGAGYVVREGLCNGDYAIVCEGAGGTNLGIGHNGVIWLEVLLEGKSAHASRPQDGVNAFEAMSRVSCGLDAYRNGLAKSRNIFYGDHGISISPTLNIGGLFAGGSGDKVNTVPSRASFTIDRRLVPGEDVTQVEGELSREVRSIVEGLYPIRVDISTLLSIAPCLVDTKKNILCQAFGDAITVVRRNRFQCQLTSGFTDLHYFVVDGGLPGIGYGVKGDHIHGIDERVRMRDIIMTARTYAEFMCRGSIC